MGKTSVLVLAMIAALVVPAAAIADPAAELDVASLAAVAAPGGEVRCDLNGDGIGDSIYLAPFAKVGSHEAAGEIYIRYGTNSGLPATPDETWNQNSPGIKEKAAANDFFGQTGTCGDFNGDDFDDIAISATGEAIGDPIVQGAGVVHVIYGSAAGLDAGPDELWHQDRRGIKDHAEVGDGFGNALTSGDFNGDGLSDLAIGVQNESIGNPVIGGAGAVHVIYGSNSGLDSGPDDFWHQNRPGIKNAAGDFDFFGGRLTAGDFDGDGNDDLVVSVLSEDFGVIRDAGAVHVIYGSGSGLDAGPDDFWHQDKKGIKDSAEENDLFGWSTAVGDFNGDNRDDLAIGIPFEGRGARVADGLVQVIYGTASGLSASTDEVWHQNVRGIKDKSESGDNFGRSVATGDFNGDGFGDLAVGVSGEDLTNPDVSSAGAVNVIYGSASGLDAGPDDFWHQNKPGVRSVAKASEYFGLGVVTNLYNGDAYSDLLITEGLGFSAANVLFGGPSGLSAAGDQFIRFP